MAWDAIDREGKQIKLEDLIRDYPDLVAFDENAFDVDIQDMIDGPEGVADMGYGRKVRRQRLGV